MRLIKNVGKNTKTFNYDWWECYYLRGKKSFWNGKNTNQLRLKCITVGRLIILRS